MTVRMEAKWTQTEIENTHAKRPSRVTKHELCIILALWMEESPFLEKPTITTDKEIKTLQGVGAVLVLPNESIFAIDCSRNDIHGVAKLLTKYPRQAKGCTIFSSRKPCSFCSKLLVQCKVDRVFYLPIEPERNEESDIKKVDHLFKVSQVAQSVFVPCIDVPVIIEARAKPRVYSSEKKHEIEKAEQARIKYHVEQMGKHWSIEWTGKLRLGLPWIAFDEDMEKQVNGDMKNLFDWISIVVELDPPGNVRFKEYGKGRPEKVEYTKLNDSGPDVGNMKWQELALHLSRMAKIIAQKTDDPKTGVGSVILMENREIVAIGWNGFPSKALYGEFPRASDKDPKAKEDEMKYSYVIHSEQNALFTRNKENIKSESTTLFVTKTPCHECVPLLIEAGVKNVVIPGELQADPESDDSKDDENAATASCSKQQVDSKSSGSTAKEKALKPQLDYKSFPKAIRDGKFKGFVSFQTKYGDPDRAKRKLSYKDNEDGQTHPKGKTPKKE